jgi:hypothetical protein
MALINSSSYRILNAFTVINILNSAKVQTTSYPHIRSRFYDLKKTSDSKIILTVKSQYSSNIEKIYDDIVKLFSVDVLLGGNKVFTTGDQSKLLGVRFAATLQRGTNKVSIFFKSQTPQKSKLPEILRPGVLNEEYFVSKINDQIVKIKEAKDAMSLPAVFDPNLDLVLFENNVKKYTISQIDSIERVGQLLGKEDVLIETKNNNKIKISLKKENFSFWSSSSKYSAAKNILDYLVNNNIVMVSKQSNGRGNLVEVSTGKKLYGIKLPATIGEIKKYCFGDQDSKVDYILIQSFNIGDFKEIKRTGSGGEDYKLELNSAIIYKEIANDIIRMMDNVYLTIVPSSKNASVLMPNYPGFKIQFATNRSSSNYYQPIIKPGTSLGRL